MSQLTQSNSTPQAGATPALSGLVRAERIVTVIAIVLGVAAAIYLLVSLLTTHEVCYGMKADRLLCQPMDALAMERALLTLMYPGVLFVAAAAGAFWQTRTTDPGARSTAYGLLVTSVAVLIGIIIPALASAGLFLAPATIAIAIAAILGTIKFIQDFRAGRASGE